MSTDTDQKNIEQHITHLQEHLNTIEQHFDKVLTENKRLRGIVRLAESELRKRRDRTEALEQELKMYQESDTSQQTVDTTEEHHDNTAS